MVELDGSDGRLPNPQGVIYTETGNGVLVGITLTNTDPGAVTVSLFLKRTGTARALLLTHSLATNATWEWPATGQIRHTLQAGDTVEGVAATAAVVDYIVSVIRRT